MLLTEKSVASPETPIVLPPSIILSSNPTKLKYFSPLVRRANIVRDKEDSASKSTPEVALPLEKAIVTKVFVGKTAEPSGKEALTANHLVLPSTPLPTTFKLMVVGATSLSRMVIDEES